MRASKQQSLFDNKIPKCFGGSLQTSHPKVKRPLSKKQTIHLVLKSEHAMGSRSMLQKRNSTFIEQLIKEKAQRCCIRIYHFVNVGNHLHLVIKLDDLKGFAPFIRAITGIIARHVLKAQRGAAQGLKFWVARPFTRIIAWGRDYNHIKSYMVKNAHQANRRHFFVAWGFDTISLRQIENLNTG